MSPTGRRRARIVLLGRACIVTCGVSYNPRRRRLDTPSAKTCTLKEISSPPLVACETGGNPGGDDIWYCDLAKMGNNLYQGSSIRTLHRHSTGEGDSTIMRENRCDIYVASKVKVCISWVHCAAALFFYHDSQAPDMSRDGISAGITGREIRPRGIPD